MEIRKAIIEDSAAWNKLIVDVKSEGLPVLYKTSFSITVESTTNYLKKILESDGSFALLCFDGKEVVGSIDMIRKTRIEEQHVGSFGMCVLNNYRGQGIGTRLLERLEEICIEENKIKKIEFEVFSNNAIGLKLYRKMNYEVEGIKKKSIIKDGNEIDMIMMGKCIK
ncbi:MAG: hypothetical protein STSR0008_25580 [Ignavibacterium sp.]